MNEIQKKFIYDNYLSFKKKYGKIILFALIVMILSSLTGCCIWYEDKFEHTNEILRLDNPLWDFGCIMIVVWAIANFTKFLVDTLNLL